MKTKKIKNELLVETREKLGIRVSEVARTTGINISTLYAYECLTIYPSAENQRKICDFYRDKGVFVYEGDVFPEYLSRERRSVPEVNFVDITELGANEPSTEDSGFSSMLKREDDRLLEGKKKALERSLSLLTNRQEKIVRGLWGLDGRTYTIEELMEQFDLSNTRVFTLRRQALDRLGMIMHHAEKSANQIDLY